MNDVPDLAGVIAAIPFEPPRRVHTRNGPKYVENAPLSAELSELYRANPGAFKANGIAVSRNPQTMLWQVARWTDAPAEESRGAASPHSDDAALPTQAERLAALKPSQRGAVHEAMKMLEAKFRTSNGTPRGMTESEWRNVKRVATLPFLDDADTSHAYGLALALQAQLPKPLISAILGIVGNPP